MALPLCTTQRLSVGPCQPDDLLNSVEVDLDYEIEASLAAGVRVCQWGVVSASAFDGSDGDPAHELLSH